MYCNAIVMSMQRVRQKAMHERMNICDLKTLLACAVYHLHLITNCQFSSYSDGRRRLYNGHRLHGCLGFQTTCERDYRILFNMMKYRYRNDMKAVSRTGLEYLLSLGLKDILLANGHETYRKFSSFSRFEDTYRSVLDE